MSLLSGIAGTLGASNSLAKALGIIATPAEVEGPFYPVMDQQDKDFDLTKIDGHHAVSQMAHAYHYCGSK